MNDEKGKPRPAEDDAERLRAKVEELEGQLAESTARADRLLSSVEDLSAKVGRLDARMRRIHKRWGFRLLNKLFGYDRKNGQE